MPSTTSTIPSEPPRGGLLLAVDLTAGRMTHSGELDRATCGHLLAACGVLSAGPAPVWVVDLAALEFCDASGLRALAAASRAAEDSGAVVRIVGARPFLRRLLPLVGLDDVPAPDVLRLPRALPPAAA